MSELNINDINQLLYYVGFVTIVGLCVVGLFALVCKCFD